MKREDEPVAECKREFLVILDSLIKLELPMVRKHSEFRSTALRNLSAEARDT